MELTEGEEQAALPPVIDAPPSSVASTIAPSSDMAAEEATKDPTLEQIPQQPITPLAGAEDGPSSSSSTVEGVVPAVDGTAHEDVASAPFACVENGEVGSAAAAMDLDTSGFDGNRVGPISIKSESNEEEGTSKEEEEDRQDEGTPREVIEGHPKDDEIRVEAHQDEKLKMPHEEGDEEKKVKMEKMEEEEKKMEEETKEEETKKEEEGAYDAKKMEELRDEVTGRWTIMVANVNKEWGPDEVEQHLQRTIPFWNEIRCEVILMQHKNLAGLKNRGVAHLELSSSAEAARLHHYLIESEFALGDAPLRVDWRRPERPDESLRAVYVANAPVTISKNDVRGLFEKFGEIESIFLSAELPKKQRRDWLVITYAKHESAVEAIRTMHGHLLNGYKMVLTFYVQSEKGKKNTEPAAAPPSSGVRASKKARYDFYCEKCDVVCQTAEKLHEHLAGKKHQAFRPSDGASANKGSAKDTSVAAQAAHKGGQHGGHNRGAHPRGHDDRRERQGQRRHHEKDARHHGGDRRGGGGGGGGHEAPREEWERGGANGQSRKRGRDGDGGYREGGGGRHDRRDWRSPPRHRQPDDRWHRGGRDGHGGGRDEPRWSGAGPALPLPTPLVSGHLPHHHQASLPLPLPVTAAAMPLQRCQLCDGFGHTAKECPSYARTHAAPMAAAYAAQPPAPTAVHAGVYATTTAYAAPHAAAVAAYATPYTTSTMPTAGAYAAAGAAQPGMTHYYAAAPAGYAQPYPHHHPSSSSSSPSSVVVSNPYAAMTAGGGQPTYHAAYMMAAGAQPGMTQPSPSPSSSASSGGVHHAYYSAAAVAGATPSASNASYGPHPRPAGMRPSK